MNEELSAEEFLEEIKSKCPHIKPNNEDDWDWTWADEGNDLLETEDYPAAELKFLELIASQPDNPDGYEGLALVCNATGSRDKALILINEAVRLASVLMDKDHMDRDVLAEIMRERDEILSPQKKELLSDHK